MTKESTTLYFHEGSSNKIYQAAIEEAEGGFHVTFAYGRRGGTLQTGSKTTTPVPLDKARTVFESLVRSKLSKGYTPGAAGTPYMHTVNEARDTGIRPQLCNPIAEDEVPGMLGDSEHWIEEKHDGKRILLRKVANEVTGINRRGLVVGLPQPILEAASRYDESFVLDGECIGDTLHVFDLLMLHDESLLTQPLITRRSKLEKLLRIKSPHLMIVQTARTADEKKRKLQELKGARAEGVVFKRHTTPYTAGRPASGGAWLKLKFTTSGSFIVRRVNTGRRSVGLEACSIRATIEVGNVTIPPNMDVPQVGDIVEVRYLYALKGGSLFQPVFLGVRDDLAPGDCTMQQLKFKAVDD